MPEANGNMITACNNSNLIEYTNSLLLCCMVNACKYISEINVSAFKNSNSNVTVATLITLWLQPATEVTV